MEAKELRIGNWVHKSLKSGKGRKIIASIGCQDIVRIYENTDSFGYEPIPLTEEWLLKFGFKRYDHETINEEEQCIEYVIGKLSIVNWGRGFIMSNAFVHGLRIKLSNVHQLQNLYFALTGEELTLK